MNHDTHLQRVHADKRCGEPAESLYDLRERAILDELHYDVQRLL